MAALPRDRFRSVSVAVLLVHISLTVGCAEPTQPDVLSPSPIITPDAVTVRVGDAQVFTVQNATVQRFALSADVQQGSDCVAVDETFSQANSIRLVALRPCRDLVHVVATIGINRSPIVALMQVQ